ncbi:Piso0_000182 [Millerozyma farinosa CBS 7064]|uniref:Piso0_000182 protein n=1 Tax=Pichia sorbitophila (strain ATCC MYA-4447 / BCRC 22081 / CBS 7064 / NBRC 10061 / NRRL Y-12695) TaxID=559304 RepID=G8YTA8_PICSO|nr:Piso0_000182 [Millerozyma farinosa CBS 7064]
MLSSSPALIARSTIFLSQVHGSCIGTAFLYIPLVWSVQLPLNGGGSELVRRITLKSIHCELFSTLSCRQDFDSCLGGHSEFCLLHGKQTERSYCWRPIMPSWSLSTGVRGGKQCAGRPHQQPLPISRCASYCSELARS